MPRKMEPIEGSETSAFKTQAPGKYLKENILQIELIIYFRFAGTISVYSSTKCRVFHNAALFLVHKIFTFYINGRLKFE